MCISFKTVSQKKKFKYKSVFLSQTDVFVTGARDGKIMIWDVRCNRKNGFNNPTITISGGHVLPVKGTTPLSGKKRRSRRTSMYQSVNK